MKLTSYFVLIIVCVQNGFYCQIDNTIMATFTKTTNVTDVSNNMVNDVNGLATNDIQFVLFTRDNPDVGIVIQDNLSTIQQNRPVKFIIHSFTGNRFVMWYKELTQTLLSKGDFSILQVDWGPLAGQPNYWWVANSTKIVGSRVGEFIVKINSDIGIFYEDFHIIGFSLGSHVAGFAGKKVFKLTGDKIRIITSLDAAGPGFEIPLKPPSERLHYKDATIVESLHTDGDFLGFMKPIGTTDYYANGGSRSQPGCGLNDPPFSLKGELLEISCSHHKSHEYYIKAIMKNGISTLQCDSYKEFLNGDCACNEVAILGLLDENENPSGTFHFQIS